MMWTPHPQVLSTGLYFNWIAEPLLKVHMALHILLCQKCLEANDIVHIECPLAIPLRYGQWFTIDIQLLVLLLIINVTIDFEERVFCPKITL